MADQPKERNAALDPNWVGVNDGAPEDSDYDPSSTQVNRGREQGLGMGAEDLQRQTDATRGPGAEPLTPGLPGRGDADLAPEGRPDVDDVDS